MSSRLLDALAARPLLLDGAMGTRLMARGLDLADDDPALWNRSHPDVVREIHARDIAAGSDALLTNTFGANAAWLDRLGRAEEMAAINGRAVALARSAAGADRFVLGTLGPTAAGLTGAYRAQAEELAEAGVDGLLLETHRSGGATVGLAEIRRAFDLPILVGLFQFDESIVDAARRLADEGADALGVNCVQPDQALSWLAEIFRATARPRILFCKPSASHPDAPIASPSELAADVPEWLRWDVRLMGGCCGATEAHVAAMRSALDEATADRV